MNTQTPHREATSSEGRKAAPGILGRVRLRLRERVDSEHEMTMNRLALSAIVLIYLSISSWYGSEASQEMLRTTGLLFGVYQVLSLVLFAHILVRPEVSVTRRMLGIALDVGMFTYCMYVGGEATAPFFPFYLWIIFGNGFRFGNLYLLVSACASIVLFGVVALTNPYWLTHPSLALGLLASLVFLPVYVAVLIRKLSAAKRQAEEANRAKSAFLASISHELRTPLNAIIGFGGLLCEQVRDQEHRQMLQTIVHSGRSLLSLINNILDFSRIEAGRMPSNMVDVDLYHAVRNIEAMLTVQAKAKSLDLSLHVTARTPSRLYADFGHIEQILVNLIANAIKFTSAGYITVCVDAVQSAPDRTRLRFEVTDTGIGIALEAQERVFESFTQADATIIDQYGGTGLGLAICKQLAKMLKGEIGLISAPGEGSTFWFEVDVTTPAPEPVEGTLVDQSVILVSDDAALQASLSDLGMRLRTFESVKSLLTAAASDQSGSAPIVIIDERKPQAMFDVTEDTYVAARELTRGAMIAIADGENSVPSSLIRRFFATSVFVPLDAPALNQAVRIARLRAEHISEDGDSEIERAPSRALSILVAEDNRTNQMVIAKILELAGHRTEIVNDGQAAVEALLDRKFDLVLMDVNMPVMNGLEAAKLYRFASLGQRSVPIVALTADATAEMETRCREAGIDVCVTKPVEPSRLLAVINSLTENADDGDSNPAELGEAITDITAHPNFRPNQGVDTRVLEDLEKLGGTEFVNEVAAQFLKDADGLLREIERAVSANDLEAFKDRLHALRSSAANIGAQRIYEMCLSWRQIGTAELTAQGLDHFDKLRKEYDRVRTSLDYRTGPAPDTNPDAPTDRSVTKFAAAARNRLALRDKI